MVGTAKAPLITCAAGKWWRAREWGAWGRISEDGPGQHNPDRSEGPWGRAVNRSNSGVAHPVRASTQREGWRTGDHAKVGGKP